jgi:hypothetical protein
MLSKHCMRVREESLLQCIVLPAGGKQRSLTIRYKMRICNTQSLFISIRSHHNLKPPAALLNSSSESSIEPLGLPERLYDIQWIKKAINCNNAGIFTPRRVTQLFI